MKNHDNSTTQAAEISLDWVRANGLILFEAVMGSTAYGTALPTSDRDVRGVFILPEDMILGNAYAAQVADRTNDVIFYEVKRFLELLGANNPNILELLNVPEDCVVYKHPLFDLILEQRDKFITKLCRDSFAGFAVQQIKKARGLNKKITNPIVERKTPFDFCYVLKDGGSIDLATWLYKNALSQESCGLVSVDHMRDMYALYVSDGYPASGIAAANGNDVVLTSVPKGKRVRAYMYFNKDAYSVHCRMYKEYTEWEQKRNQDRYQANISNEKNYDAKNMMHCVRVLDMALEIATGKGIIVRRPNRLELLAIRRAEREYEELVADAERRLSQADAAFNASSLPAHVDKRLVTELLVKIRKAYYASGK
jgi:hypothetical protein